MTQTKQAQHFSNLDGFHVNSDELKKFLEADFSHEDEGDLQIELELEPQSHEEEISLESEPHAHGDLEVALEEPHVEEETLCVEPETIEVDLPFLPGAEDQSEIEKPEEEEVHDLREDDPWYWTPENFKNKAPQVLHSVPKHSGRDIMGIERAISYLQKFVSHCSKVARGDTDNKLDIELLEKLRDEALHGIDRLEERLDELHELKGKKKKKKAEYDEDTLVKEARMPNIQVQVPLFISSLARSIVNGTVSAGKSSEELFRYVVAEYKLDKREQTELTQLLADMGLIPPGSTDLALPRDTKEYDIRSEKNINLMPQYQA